MNKYLLSAWGVAIVATVGSLYFSEVMGFIPCTLCWYQRILMYPLVVILGVAFYHNDKNIVKYVLPLSIFGMILSGYHYTLQKLPIVQDFGMCKTGVPCSGQYINWFGFITIPFLAFVAFTFITIIMVLMRRQAK